MRARNADAVLAPLFQGEIRKWQRANDVWPNSTATVNRRRISRFRCFARTTAARISFRSPAVSSAANGATTSPAGPWRRPWSAGACHVQAAAHFRLGRCAILQRGAGGVLRIRTPTERTAPESVLPPCTLMFTARCRSECQTAHHIKHRCDRVQPTTDDEC